MAIIQYFRSGARWSVLLLAFLFPLSIAAGNIMLGLLLICGLAGYAKHMWEVMHQDPVARAAMLLFSALLIGCAYGTAIFSEAFTMLAKYADLAFIPLLLAIFKDESLRKKSENAFLLAMMLTAILSWLVGAHVIGSSYCLWDGCSPDNPAIFVNSIAHNTMLAYASFLFALRAELTVKPSEKVLYIGCALLTSLDVLVMVLGRTGYLALGALLILFVWTALQRRLNSRGGRLGWMAVFAVIMVASLAAWSAYQLLPRMHERIDLVISESAAWKSAGKDDTSTGLRLEFYTNSVKLVAQHPWTGVGTGGFAEAYRQLVEGTGMIPARNPHNEYFHLTIQLGIIGLLLFLYYLLMQWRTARQIPDAHSSIAATGLVLTLLISSMINTPLMDHVEGLFFAFMGALYFASFVPAEKKNA